MNPSPNTKEEKRKIYKARVFDGEQVYFLSSKPCCQDCLGGDGYDIDGCCCIHAVEYDNIYHPFHIMKPGKKKDITIISEEEYYK